MVNNTPKIAQGKFNQISKYEGELCFHLNSGEHDLVEGMLIEINFAMGKNDYKKVHYVGSHIDSPSFKMFTIQDDLMLNEEEKETFGININKTIEWILV